MLEILFDFITNIPGVDLFDVDTGHHHRLFLLEKFEEIHAVLYPDVIITTYNYIC